MPMTTVYRPFVAVLLSAMICSACVRAPLQQSIPDDFQHFIRATNNLTLWYDWQQLLRMHNVENVIPAEQLFIQGSDWKKHGLSKYAFPAKRQWPNMIKTLKLLQRFIIPAIGPIEVVSSYRTPGYNLVAGGATRSHHLEFSAVDIMPLSSIDRGTLHKKLLQIWRVNGKGLNMGLGLYNNRRVHIDTGGYRKWQ